MFVTVPVIRGFDAVSQLFGVVHGRGVICGGYARYCASPLLSPSDAGDVDVYCHSVEAFEELKEDLGLLLKPRIETSRAVTYERTTSGLLAYCPEVQLVKPVEQFRIKTVGSTEDILDNFDFTVVRAAIVSPSEAIVDEDFIADESEKRLSLRNIHCPISSTLRVLKYANRGYFISPSDVLPLFLDWEGRPQEYRDEIIQGLLDIETARKTKNFLTTERLTAIYELMSVD